MRNFLLVISCFLGTAVLSQSVGIGTNTPNTSSILDLGPGAKPIVLPRLTTAQMNAVANPAQGMMIYNTTQHQFYGFERFRNSTTFLIPTSRWQPLTTGPQMVSWGIVDSFAAEVNGSGNYSVVWDATNNWYTLNVTSHPFYKDSMLLIIQSVGNGSWDQTVSIGELIESATVRKATIKFTDVSRTAAGWSSKDARRRSWFYFTLFNLRRDPYDILNP